MPAVAGADRITAALLARFGSPCTARRQSATRVAAADGSDATPWEAVADGPTRVLLEPLTVAAAQRLWGVETAARFRGFVLAAADVAGADGLMVTTGDYAGRSFRVVEPMPILLAGLQVLGLAQTPETFA